MEISNFSFVNSPDLDVRELNVNPFCMYTETELLSFHELVIASFIIPNKV